MNKEEAGMLLRKYLEIGGKKRYSTTVVVYRAVEVKKPAAGAPNKGVLLITASDRELQGELNKVFRDVPIIPLERLSVVPKKAVWSLRVDVLVVADQGGVFELATEGVFQAIAEAVFPESYLLFGYHTLCTKTLAVSPLMVPTAATRVFIGDEERVDPLASEYEEATGVLTVCTSDHRELLYLSFLGAVELDRVLGAIEQTVRAAGGEEAA